MRQLINSAICRVLFPIGLKRNTEDLRTSPAAYRSAMEMVRGLDVGHSTRMWMLNSIRDVVAK